MKLHEQGDNLSQVFEVIDVDQIKGCSGTWFSKHIERFLSGSDQ